MAKKDRVAFILPGFTYDQVRPAHKEAMTFLEMGYEVLLLCSDPPVEEYLGMQTIRARRLGSSRLGSIFSTPILTWQAARLDADLYVLTNPFALIPALLLALFGRRVIYATHEDFLRKTEIRPYLPVAFRKCVGRCVVLLERLVSQIALATIVTQPNVQGRYARAIVIENAPATSGPIHDRARAVFASLPTTTVPELVYAGSLTRDRGLFRMLDLVERLNKAQAWRLRLVGRLDPSPELREARHHPGWRYVIPIGYVHHSESLAHIRRADIGLGLLDDVGGYAQTSMTKLYEYMLSETPFVVSDFPRWRDSIRNVPAGLFVDPYDTESMAQRIIDLFADKPRYRTMQKIGRTFVEQEFNWDIVAQPLKDLVYSMHQIEHRPARS